MRVYLFGPMRGYAEHNFPAFDHATDKLRAQGHEVFSPAEHDRKVRDEGATIRDMLCADLMWICQFSEAIVGLPGWCQSPGSLAEVHTAWALDIPVYEYYDFFNHGADAIRVYP